MRSLPVPVSPNNRTVESVAATISASCSTSWRAALWPTIPSKPALEGAPCSEESSSSTLQKAAGANRKFLSHPSESKTFPKFIMTPPRFEFWLSRVISYSPRLLYVFLSLNPLADVRGTILQLDAVRFATLEKLDRIPIYER